MVELLFPVALRQDMRDGLLTLPSLGQAAGVCYETKTVRYICLPIYGNTVRKTRQALRFEYLYSFSRTGLPNWRYYSMVEPPSAQNLSLIHI